MTWRKRPGTFLPLVVVIAMVGAACGGGAEESATTQPSSQVTSSSTTTPTTQPPTSSTTTTAPATTTTLNPWPSLGDELAEPLGCGLVAEGPPMVEAAWVLQCDSEFAVETIIVLFDSDDQQGRWLASNRLAQLVLGKQWSITASGEPFPSVDQVALAVDGIVLIRANPLVDDPADHRPPVNDAGLEQGIDEAWDEFDAALSVAEGGDPMTAITIFNRLVAAVPADGTDDEAALRSAALLARGLAYEQLLSDPPAPRDTAPSAGTMLGISGEVAISYQWLVDAYVTSENETVHKAVTRGLFQYGFFHTQARDFELAVDLYDEAIRRGIASGDPRQDFYVADSMFFRALSLADSGDLNAGVKGLEELIDRFENSPDPDIQPIIGDAKEFLLQMNG